MKPAATLLRLFGGLLLLSALALPFLRADDRPVEHLVARWAPPPSAFVELDGQLLHYRDEGPRGDPVPLLLIHGTSSSLHTWEGWAKVLRQQRRVISLDLPAYGLTGPWTGANQGRPYTAPEYTRVALQLLDHLGVQRFAVAGNSLGGEVAWRLAAQVPQRVDRLVLVDAAGYQVTPKDIPLGWRIARLPVLGGLSKHLLPRPLIVQGLVSVVGDPAHISEAMVDRYYELTLREGNRAAFIERARQWTPGEGVQRIQGVNVPTLVLWGGRDRLLPPELAQRFAADIPGAQLRIFDELGHIPQEEDPARTVAAVLPFLGLAAPATSAASAASAPR